jgi:hypothetical protein
MANTKRNRLALIGLAALVLVPVAAGMLIARRRGSAY